jgi:hypothetical protein
VGVRESKTSGRERPRADESSLQTIAARNMNTLNPASVEWQQAMWRRWPLAADWPDILDSL